MAKTTTKAQTKQPMPTVAMNCASILLGFCRQQLPRKNRQPTSATARRHRQTQRPHKSRPWPTRSPHSQERWPTRRTYPTAVVETEAVVEAKAGGGGSSGGKGQAKCDTVQYTKPQCMGGYCLLHCYHPAGVNHTSTACQWKQANHNVMATWANRKGGSVYWPPPIRVSIQQQSHAAYAGKSAPTN